MPWTRKQVMYLLSGGSPLTGKQKTKMKAELHANPAMGHMEKGGKARQLAVGLDQMKSLSEMRAA
jgi:hypothetical protein